MNRLSIFTIDLVYISLRCARTIVLWSVNTRASPVNCVVDKHRGATQWNGDPQSCSGRERQTCTGRLQGILKIPSIESYIYIYIICSFECVDRKCAHNFKHSEQFVPLSTLQRKEMNTAFSLNKINKISMISNCVSCLVIHLKYWHTKTYIWRLAGVLYFVVLTQGAQALFLCPYLWVNVCDR
jgi:hypothetical protein